MTTLIGLALLWGREQVSPAQEWQAVEAIRSDGRWRVQIEYCGPLWLSRLAGDQNRLPFFVIGPKLEYWNSSTTLGELNDEGLERLRPSLVHLHRCTDVSINGAKITGRSLAVIASMKQIECLSLWGTRIGDDGLEDLYDLPQLRFLNLSMTKITDRGLGKLSSLQHLEQLTIYNTGIPPSGLRLFRDARPDVEILDN